jgi:hypothetical protein
MLFVFFADSCCAASLARQLDVCAVDVPVFQQVRFISFSSAKGATELSAVSHVLRVFAVPKSFRALFAPEDELVQGVTDKFVHFLCGDKFFSAMRAFRYLLYRFLDAALTKESFASATLFHVGFD